MDKLLVKNARVYQDGQFARADVLCEDALIAKIGENLTDDDARIIDAGGMRLAPGFIDVAGIESPGLSSAKNTQLISTTANV